jgi:hypothetical protein
MYFKISKHLDKVSNNLKDENAKVSNKFHIRIVYVFNVGIFIISFKLLFIKSNIFSFKCFI